MARFRTIKPSFWTAEQVMSVSRDARLIFIGMLNFCDDYGNHPASASMVKAAVLPCDSISIEAVEKLCTDLERVGLIIRYRVSDRDFWHIDGWSRHQKIDKPSQSHWPQFDEQSATTRRTFDEPSPCNVREGSVREGKGKRDAAPPSGGSSLAAAEFDSFWASYPHRDGVKRTKAESQAAFRKLKADERPLLLLATGHYAEACAQTGTYTLDPVRFIRKGTWRDFIERPQVKVSNGKPAGSGVDPEAWGPT